MKQKIFLAGVLLSVNYSCIGSCLVKGTKIKTNKNYKCIEDLSVGDHVVTLIDGQTTTARIIKTFHGKVDSLCTLKTFSSEIETSPLHKIYSNNNFTEAYKLREGDLVSLLHRKEQITVKHVTFMSELVDVFSIALDVGFVYFANEFLVHNKSTNQNEIQKCPEILYEGVNNFFIKMVKNEPSENASLSIYHECDRKISKLELIDQTRSFLIEEDYHDGELLHIFVKFSPEEKGEYRAELSVESTQGRDSILLLGEYR